MRQPSEKVDRPDEWLREAGRLYYRCRDNGAHAVSDTHLPHCLWHGEDCIDWYLQVPADQAAAYFGSNIAEVSE